MERNREHQRLLSTVEEGAAYGSSGSRESIDVSASDSSSNHFLFRRYGYAAIVLLIATLTVIKVTYSNNKAATAAQQSSKFTFGSMGLVPPYVAKGLPSSPSMDNVFDSDPAPFSLKSPAEVGIDDFIRSMDTRPGKVFGSLRREDAPSYAFYEPQFDPEAVPKPAMPTNAWYQSLLVGSVNEGKLDINNRVYTIRECARVEILMQR